MEGTGPSLECHCTPVGDVEYDPADEESPAAAVVTAVAAVSGAEPTELEPLHETIDTEALNRLFEARGAESSPTGTILSFSVDGWNVFVRDDGRVRVCDPTGPADPSPIFE